MATNFKNGNLIDFLVGKATLKQDVYQKTYSTFKMFCQVIRDMVSENQSKVSGANKNILFECRERGEFEMELKFAGDVLIFMMHSNVFEFNRDHEVMKTTYIKEDPVRSYCGMINIYNFLADSFKYNRINDIGYMIGRVFINREMHYFIEGKREIGLLYNNFANATIDKEIVKSIIESSMRYTLNFDLLTPPYDSVKEVTVQDMLTTLDNMSMRTGKRLGFRFQADHE